MRARRGFHVWSIGLALLLVATGVLVGCSANVGRDTASPPPSTGEVGTPIATPFQVTYVALGASDSFGIGADHPATQSWPSGVAKALGESVHLLNLGVPGATADQAIRDELPIALDADPDVVTVLLGVNDLDDGVPLANFTTNLRSLLASLTTGTHAHIYVGNLPDLSHLPYLVQRHGEQTLAREVPLWNAAIASACSQFGATLVDVYTGWNLAGLRPEYVSADGLHPSTLGAAHLAELFSTAIVASPARSAGPREPR